MVLAGGCATGPEAGPRRQASIVKVLPHWLDEEGRHTLSPSLYERDAYQDYLRNQPERASALRFDVLWKAPVSGGLTIKVEMRGIRDKQTTLTLLQSQPMAHEGGREWSSLVLEGESFRSLGQLQAWRASLWSGDLLLEEQRSFLW